MKNASLFLKNLLKNTPKMLISPDNQVYDKQLNRDARYIISGQIMSPAREKRPNFWHNNQIYIYTR
jgi:hypothetical protein